jgi:undecaprenyl-diphosphatase
LTTIERLNQSIFLRINAGPNAPAWAIQTAVAFADFLIYVVPLLLLFMWLRGDRQRRGLALKAFLVAFSGVGFNQVIGMVWQHPRPFMIGLGHTLIPHVADSSFPSDHATVLFGISLTLLFARATLSGLGVLLAGLCVAWARIFLGVHFPLDMLGAAGVALVAYAVVTALWNRLGSKATTHGETVYRKVLAKPIALGFLRR